MFIEKLDTTFRLLELEEIKQEQQNKKEQKNSLLSMNFHYFCNNCYKVQKLSI